MSELDVAKERIAYLKFWLGILVVTDISLFGWLLSNVGGANLSLVLGGCVAAVAITVGILLLPDVSSDKSKDCRSFSYGNHRCCFAGRCLLGVASDSSGRHARPEVRELNRYSLVEKNTAILLALRTRRI